MKSISNRVANPSPSILWPLPYEGKGTAYVESLSSFCSRLATAHDMTVHALFRILGVFKDAKFSGANHPSQQLCTRFQVGTLNRNRKNCLIFQSLGAGLNRDDLACLTPQILARVVMPDRMMRTTRAWCSPCFREDEVTYDRLIWGFSLIERCPVHRISLDTRCPNCNRTQRRYSSIYGLGFCSSCGFSLIHPSDKKNRLQSPGRGEKDLIELIDYSSKHAGYQYSTDAPLRFEKAYKLTNTAKYDRDWRGSNASTILGSKGAKKKRTLIVLLDLAASTGASLHQLLSDPESAAKMRRLINNDRGERTEQYPKKSKAKLVKIKNELLAEINKRDIKSIQSIATFCRRHKVLDTYLKYWFPVLMQEWALNINLRQQLRMKQLDEAARLWVRQIGLPGIKKGRWVSSNEAIEELRAQNFPLRWRIREQFKLLFEAMDYEETRKLYVTVKTIWGPKKVMALAQWSAKVRRKKISINSAKVRHRN